MTIIGVAILATALGLSVAIGILSHGHVLFLGLPLLVGAPLATLFGRRR